MIKHPKILWILCFGKLWDTFSYFGTQTILALYLISIFHLDRDTSYILYGAYAAFAYSIPIIGGIISDRWIGSQHSIVSGYAFNIVGNLMMISLNRYVFCLGLATSLIGSGLYKSNSTSLIGTLYKAGDQRKESGFTWCYLAMNIGGALGPLVYGIIAYSLRWNYIFFFSAAGILVSGLWFVKNWGLFKEHCNPRKIATKFIVVFYFGISMLCLCISAALYSPDSINIVILLVFIVSALYLFFAIRCRPTNEKKQLLAVILLCFMGMFYFIAGLQTGTTITLFLQHEIDKGAVNMDLPGSVFNTLYCLFVVALAPVFSCLFSKLKSKKITINSPTKIAIGIFFASLGIAVFSLATSSKFILVNIIAGYFLLSAGELILTPAAYTAISDYAPTDMKNTMMGCWLLFIAIGSYFSSILANTSHFLVSHLPFKIDMFSGEFAFISGFTFIIGLIVMVLAPYILKVARPRPGAVAATDHRQKKISSSRS